MFEQTAFYLVPFIPRITIISFTTYEIDGKSRSSLSDFENHILQATISSSNSGSQSSPNTQWDIHLYVRRFYT